MASPGVLPPDVVDAARAGEADAIAAVYRAFAPAVIGYLRGSGTTDPEALAGDVFLGVVRGLAAFTGDAAALRTWVFTIAHRRIVDDRRRQQRWPTSPLEAQRDTFGVPDETDRVLGAVASAPVRDALRRLTDDQRNVVLLRIVAGLSLEETATAMNKAVPAVKMLQQRALATLARTISREAVT